MSTLAELRTALRVLLKDNGAEGYLWGDAALNLYLNDALRDYGRALPQQKEVTVTTGAGQREYGLPADCLSVTRVVETAGRQPLREGSAEEYGYEVYGGRLILSPDLSETEMTLGVRYLAPHATLAGDGDLSTVPAADEDLLLALACAEALQGLSAEEAKRQQFEGRAGQRVETAAALYRRQYERGIRARMAGVRAGRLVVGP